MKIPTNVPERGFYYHYKHDAAQGVNHFAYELVGTGVHTEDDCRHEDSAMVAYRPLYESEIFTAGKLLYLRPLEMWVGNVTKNEKTFPRFEKIVDEKIISELEAIKEKMYGGQ